MRGDDLSTRRRPAPICVICSLGEEWKDPTKIPVKEIIEEWRVQATRGRYENKMWTSEALEAAADATSSSAAAPTAAPLARRVARLLIVAATSGMTPSADVDLLCC